MTSEEREGLRKIRRWRLWAWFLLLSYVPVVWMVKRETNSDLAVAPFILVWVIGFVRNISRMAFSVCPRCGQLYHSVSGTPTFFNLLTMQCLHCGLRLKIDRVIYPSMEG
jgi:hypothetical protein